MNVHVETAMNAPASAVWDEWAVRFGDIARWSSAVEESRSLRRDELPGDVSVDSRAPVAGRQTTSKFATAREYFTNFDADAMTYTFGTLDLPKILSSATHTSTVVATGEGTSRLVTDVEMILWGPFKIMQGVLKKRFGKVMEGLHAELNALVG